MHFKRKEQVSNTMIIKVTAPEEIRFSRLQKRDNINERRGCMQIIETSGDNLGTKEVVTLPK